MRAALAAAEVRASVAEGALVAAKNELSYVQAVVSASEDMIRHLRLQIAKLQREQFGHSAERHARLSKVHRDPRRARPSGDGRGDFAMTLLMVRLPRGKGRRSRSVQIIRANSVYQNEIFRVQPRLAGRFVGVGNFRVVQAGRIWSVYHRRAVHFVMAK